MISLHRWDPATRECKPLDAGVLAADPEGLRSTTDVLWIDLDAPTEEEERLVLERFFPVHPLTLEDVTKTRREPESPPHFPKAEEFPDYLFVVVTPLAENFLGVIKKSSHQPFEENGHMTTQLSALLTDNVLVTHHYQPVAGVRELRTFLAKHGAQAERGPDYLFHLLLDAVVDEYAFALDHLDDALERIEDEVFKRPQPWHLSSLLGLKREVIALRKALVYQREVMARLARGEFDLIDEREMVYYRNVYDHLVRFAELAEGSREAVGDLMQAHLGATSNRLNETMKVLTMISTTLLPMTLISGIYGMNLQLPEFGWKYGYPWALALMALVGLGSFLFFRWKKWI